MTGGSTRTGRINEQLAEAAKEAGSIAMAVGSQSVALKDHHAIETFTGPKSKSRWIYYGQYWCRSYSTVSTTSC